MNESGYANHAEKQAAYVKWVARKRKKALERRDEVDRVIEKYERIMDIAGNPHLFDKMCGFLAQQHEVSKQYVSTIRKKVLGHEDL